MELPVDKNTFLTNIHALGEKDEDKENLLRTANSENFIFDEEIRDRNLKQFLMKEVS